MADGMATGLGPIPDRNIIAKFMDSLFKQAMTGLIELNAMREVSSPAVRLFKLDELDEAIDFAFERSSERWNVYVSAGLRREDLESGRSGKSDDVISVTALKIDLDDKRTFLPALLRVRELGFMPNLISLTAHVPHKRAHLWWVLEEPTSDLEQVRSIEGKMIAALGADPATKDVRRVMRLPGTVNYPSTKKAALGRVPEFVQLGEVPRAPYSLEEIASIVDRQLMNGEIGSGIIKHAPPANLLSPQKTDNKIVSRLQECGPGKWHTSMRDVSASLVNRGLKDDEIVALLQPYREEGFSVEETDKELRALIASARAKYDPKAGVPEVKAKGKMPCPEPWKWRDGGSFEPFPWIYPNVYPRGFLSLTVSRGGLGKSTLALTEAVSIALGRDLLAAESFFDAPKIPKFNVWYLNLEDPMDLIDRRLAGLARAYGIEENQISDGMFVNSALGYNFSAAIETGRAAEIDEGLFSQMAEFVREHSIDLVIIDPFISSHDLDENSNQQIDRLAKRWSFFANEMNIAVHFVHHTRKNNGQRDDAESSRGAKALVDAARLVRVLTKIDGDDDEAIVEASLDKNNLGATGSKTHYRLVAVDLGNSRDCGDGNLASILCPGDSVGVVKKYEDSFSTTKSLPPEFIAKIKAGLGSKPYRENIQAKDWIGFKIADLIDVGSTSRREKSHLKKMIESLLEMGVLERFKGTNKSNRATPYVRLKNVEDLHYASNEEV